jgi:hypothetical protein
VVLLPIVLTFVITILFVIGLGVTEILATASSARL